VTFRHLIGGHAPRTGPVPEEGAFMVAVLPDAAATEPEGEPTPSPVDIPPTYITPEARLLAAGWPCPDPELARVILRRDALRAGCAELRVQGAAGLDPVSTAVIAGDGPAVAAGLRSHLIGTWADEHLGRDSGFIFEWSQALESQLWEFVYRNAQGIVTSLEGFSDDARYLRSIAEAALAAGFNIMGQNGRWLPPAAPTAPRGASMIPR
jgi:hypothetical protein